MNVKRKLEIVSGQNIWVILNIIFVFCLLFKVMPNVNIKWYIFFWSRLEHRYHFYKIIITLDLIKDLFKDWLNSIPHEHDNNVHKTNEKWKYFCDCDFELQTVPKKQRTRNSCNFKREVMLYLFSFNLPFYNSEDESLITIRS